MNKETSGAISLEIPLLIVYEQVQQNEQCDKRQDRR